jgi:GNAT superfamily N-acetyltransferase
MDDQSLVAGFLHELAARMAGRVEQLPWGFAVFNADLPRVWELNVLWVADAPGSLTAEALDSEVERLQGGAGLLHRYVLMTDEVGGDRLAGGLRKLGWSTRRWVVMIHRDEPDRPADIKAVREVDEPTIRAFTEANLRSHASPVPDEAMEQILGQKRVAATAGARFFAIESGGAAASGCDLFTDGRVAQIEAVMTLPEHRNQGLSRAVVLRALNEAREAGHDLVFLLAEEEDWPRELYARLGFEDEGFVHVFTRSMPVR